jgi:hypothetical protein
MACLRDLASMSFRGIEERSDVQIAVSLEEHALRRSGQQIIADGIKGRCARPAGRP